MINVVFFGTPEFAQHFLESLNYDEEIFVSCVVAQPDKPVGRKKVITSPPTIKFAKTNDIPYYQPETLKNPDIVDHLKQFNADVFVIVAYGKIIPQDILDIPKHGSINVHPSLLPKYRGPSPIQSAIANQDTETGISIMLIDEKMDHGPILLQQPMKIDADDTSETLREKVASVGSLLLLQGIKGHVKGTLEAKPQDHNAATFCKLIKKSDGEIDWIESAKAIEAKARAYTPWPGIFTTWNGKMLKLNHITIQGEIEGPFEPGQVKIEDGRMFVGTNSTPIEILELQPEGKPKMNASAFINGNREIDGVLLG